MISNVEHQLAMDSETLAATTSDGHARFRVWRTESLTVVVGRGVEIAREVNLEACAKRCVPVLRRLSGGRSVVIGPGTLQYALALAHDGNSATASISAAKAFCNGLLLDALAIPRLRSHASGDLVLEDRKVAGLALKRTREATLVHGTILLECDLTMLGELLLHPSREPEYRRGRAHAEFLRNLGPIDAATLERRVISRLAVGT